MEPTQIQQEPQPAQKGDAKIVEPQIERLKVRSLKRLSDDTALAPPGVPNDDQCSCQSP